ncbi:hypothetical protein MTO96_014862 [Rhipicephalus appendiculatus]
MGRQTRTLPPVPAEHLELEEIPSKDVHDHLQVIRRQQNSSYDRNDQKLTPANARTTCNDVRHPPEDLESSYGTKASRGTKVHDCEGRRRS